jgi:lipid II:glycine glycyltransferase (peptidoglycan interpeptide bridge formation enzyme)
MSSHGYILRKVPAAQWKQWDQFVNEHPRGHFLQSWGWGELKANGGWYPLRLALMDEQQQQIVAAAQVLCRTPAHLPLWTGHLAYIPKGPVIDWSQPQLCQAFFTQLNAYLRQRGALALRMEPNQEVKALEQVSMSASSIVGEPCLGDRHESLGGSHTPFAGTLSGEQATLPLLLYPAPPVQPVRTILLDLAPDEATLLAHMKEKWRYNLRLAERKGVKVREARTREDVHAWYALMQTTSERDHFGIHTLDYYLRAWHTFAPRRQARLFLAEYGGQVLAGIFVALFARQGIYLFGASGDEHRNLMPNYLLQWEAIRWAKQQGATRYDFGGIAATDNENDPLAGIYRFKRGWGGKVVRFVGCYEHIYRPVAMKLAKRYVPKLV